MDMRARTDHPVLDAIANRWSPYAYDPRSVPAADLRSIFEAARWTASSYNEQPWRFLVVPRDDEAAFADALNCLMDFNKGWAKDAGALVFAVAADSYARSGKPNNKAHYDLGQAVAQLSIEAAARGINTHQIGGLKADKAREVYGVPEGYDVICAFTLGYAAAVNEGGPAGRSRRPQTDLVFGTTWGEPADFLD